MRILGYEIRKEKRDITIGPSTSVGLPYGGIGTNLSAETAMKLSAVYRCVDVKSDSIATMPWDVLTWDGKGWVKDEFHISYSMLNSQPNASMSKFDFMKSLAAKMELNGNAYVKINRDAVGNPISLILLNGSITMYIREDFSTYYEVIEDYLNRSFMVEGEDMIHVKNFSYNGYLGISTLSHAANITSLAYSADGQAKGYYENGVNMNGIVSVPGKITSDKASELKTNWKTSVAYNSTTGVGGGVVVLEGGATYTPIQINPKDAQMLETRNFNVVDICRFFGVHPSKAFDTSSNGYAAVEGYQLGYITDTVTPCKTKIENEFNRKLFRPSQRDKTKVVLDIESLISADLDTRANYYSKMFQLGTYSPDDICRKLNLPIESSGKGNKRYVQVNLTELGKEPLPAQNKNTNVVNDGTGN